jgi:hypothetical protein
VFCGNSTAVTGNLKEGNNKALPEEPGKMEYMEYKEYIQP